jgi:hypothetical protein
MLNCLTIVFLILVSCSCECQTLVFQKNKFRTAHYKCGDIISFNLKGDNSKFTGQIVGFEDSLIVFKYYKISPHEITHLYVDDKTKIWFVLRYKYEKIFFIGGVAFLAADLFNTQEVSGESLTLGTALITSGFLARWLVSKKIRIRGSRRFYIVDH